MSARRTICALAACGVVLAGIRPASASGLEVEPYKLVRSLQRIQDEIADGDKSALGMQFELVKLIDQGFRAINAVELRDPKNAKALISYAMAGGNPDTLEMRLTDLGGKDDQIVRLAVAVLVYQKGAGRTAEARLKNVDPMKIGGLFGAYLALVRGLVSKDDDGARTDFDTARLLAPGTLVEEAALRRLMTIHKRRQDSHSFLRVASRYARRYIASPYAVQFASEFVGGVIALDELMDMESVMEVIEFMPEPYRSAVVVRLMRTATVEGHSDLVRHLAELVQDEKDDRSEPDVDPQIDARRALYAQISEVTSENIDAIVRGLASIDRSVLSDGDRELLDAVLAIAKAVMDPEPTVTASIAAGKIPHRESKFHDPRDDAPDNGLPAFDEFVGGTRDRLGDIDALLEDIQ
jgi:chemotaxis protein MotC